MKLSIRLMGGLGNQLFQYFAALYFLENGFDDVELRIPELNHAQNSIHSRDIEAFVLDPRIDLVSKPYQIYDKLDSFALRFNLNSRKFFFKRSMLNLVTAAANLVNVIQSKEISKLIVSDNLGYFNCNFSDNSRFVGYAQTYRFFDSIVSHNKFLKMKNTDNQVLDYYRKLSLLNSPLIVHIRRGDYALESKFGLLSSRYYSQAIKKALATNDFGEIWLFSDDIEQAIEIFPKEYLSLTKVVEDENLSSTEIFEIMRQGKGFVIANSSYSYWASMLAYATPLVTVAPKPWFREITQPVDLLPPNWIQHESHFM